MELSEEVEEDGVMSYKNKYRQLKSRLKYLIYEHECFENDIQKAQTKLLQLSRDKSFLLDQLMRYEAVVLSGGEETDYSSEDDSTIHPPSTADNQKMETGPKSDVAIGQAIKTDLPLSTSKPTATKPTVTTSLNSTSKTPNAKSGGVKKSTKASTNVSAVAAAKITKAVARARQNPQSSPPMVNNSSLIVSLPLSTTSLSGASGGRGKQPQTTPTKHPQMPPLMSAQPSSTAAILASIPVPPRLTAKTLGTTSTLPVTARPTGKSLSTAIAMGGKERQTRIPPGAASSSSSSSSSSDSEDGGDDSGSESSGSSSSKEDIMMDTRGPVPIVHSVPIPAGAPQLVRPKAIVSPVKAPPKLIPLNPTDTPSSIISPLTTSPGSQRSPATRFIWSNRTPTVVPGGGGTDNQATPTPGFISIAPLSSPTLNKPSSGSAFQLVTSPPGSAPLNRPPSLHNLSGGTESGRPG